VNKAAIVTEDKDTQLVVRTALECAGFDCEIYASSSALLRVIKRDDHSVVVADIDSAGVDCQALLEWRRNWLNPAVTVIAVGRGDPKAAAAALDAGVDDFVARPVRGAELLARVAAAGRRRTSAPRQEETLAVAGCVIDRAGSAIASARGRVELTARELAIAQILFANVNRVVTRARISHDVWGADEELTGRSIEQHIYQLRRKLRRCAGSVLALRGVYGSGYRLDVVESGTQDGTPRAPAKDSVGAPSRIVTPRLALAAPALLFA
jgi:DNA-binding response OmpR family regulator